MKRSLNLIVFVSALTVASVDAQSQEKRLPSIDDSRDELLEEAAQIGNTKLQELLRSLNPMTLSFKYDSFQVWVPGDIETLFDWNWTAPDRDHDFQRVRDRHGKHAMIFGKELEELKRRRAALLDAGVLDAPAPSQAAIAEAARAEDLYPPEMKLPVEMPVYAQPNDRSGPPAALLPAGTVIDAYEKSSDSTACHVMQMVNPWAEGWINAVSLNGYACGLGPQPPARERYAPRGTVDTTASAQPNQPAKPSIDTTAPLSPETSQQVNSLIQLGPTSLVSVEVIALGGVGLLLLILNPRTEIVVLAFIGLGTPIWWWLYQSYSGGLNEFSDPVTLGSSVFHSALTFIWPFSAFWLAFFIISFYRHVKSSRENGGYASGVPHCRFDSTDDGGFIVKMFNWDGLGLASVAIMLIGLTLVVWYFVAGITRGFMATLVLGAAAAYFSARRQPTRIRVARDGVFINDVKIELDHFHRFTLVGANLGCEYGMHQRVVCTGWTLWKLKEIAAGLNANLDHAKIRFAIQPVPSGSGRPSGGGPSSPPPASPDPPPRRPKKY